MKVYVVTIDIDYEYTKIVGVYSTRIKAHEAGYETKHAYEIEDYVVDVTNDFPH
jgi:hypothetical protein